MPRPNDVIMARSIYDNDDELLPKALVIDQQSDLKESLIDPDMDRSNNRSTVRNDSDDCDDCCDCNGCCDDNTLLLLCCICYACDT